MPEDGSVYQCLAQARHASREAEAASGRVLELEHHVLGFSGQEVEENWKLSKAIYIEDASENRNHRLVCVRHIFCVAFDNEDSRCCV